MSKKEEQNNRPSEESEALMGKEVKSGADCAKVIDRGDAKLIISGHEKIKGKTAEPREISVEPRVVQPVKKEPSDVTGSLVEESPVVRLQSDYEPGQDRIKVEKAKFEKLEVLPDKVEQQEEEWGSSKKTVGWWITIAGAGAATLLIVALFLKYAYDGDDVRAENTDLKPLLARDDLYKGSPQKWFRDNDVFVRKQAIEVLKKYLAAENDAERSHLVRNPTAYLENVDEWPGAFQPRAIDDKHCTWSVSDTEGYAFAVLNGKDAEFMPIRIYFIRHEDGKIKLDWHATVGWSAIPIKTIKKDLVSRQELIEKNKLAYELAIQKARMDAKNLSDVPRPQSPAELYSEPVTLRCLLTRRNEFYVGPYNDRDHSAFMLRSPDRRTYLWGYVERNSDLDEELRRLLDHGRFVVDLKKDIPVTVKVKWSAKGALPSQLELIELLHPNWVTP